LIVAHEVTQEPSDARTLKTTRLKEKIAKSSTAFIAWRRRSNARAPLTRTGFHPFGTKYVGNITVKTGRRLSSATFTVHRRKSGAQSAKEETIITRFIRRTAMECAAVRSLASLPMLSGKS
jgi:hypothetical protein